MRITVGTLHKMLGELIDAGHGRKPVVVDKTTFTHNCEADGVTVLDLGGMGIAWIPLADGDGSVKVRKDGTECGRSCCVLVGDSVAGTRGNEGCQP